MGGYRRAGLVVARDLGRRLPGVGLRSLHRAFAAPGATLQELFWYPLLGHALAFYWLIEAVRGYASTGAPLAILIFVLFLVVGAVQFLVLGFLYRRLRSAALAVLILEALGLRIFPWYFGHTQLAFGPLVQVAELGGVLLVSFVLMWAAESRWGLLILGAAVAYGLAAPAFPAGTVPVVLVQGNVGNREDVARYAELSRGHEGKLVIWPESALHAPIFDGFRQRADEPRLAPVVGPCLFGAYSWDDQHNIYNTAFAMLSDGALLPPYHKRVLLPFAEHAYLAPVQLAPGRESTLFSLSGLKIGPLICYEDTLPGTVRQSVAAGADVLVNMANDSWFGPLGARQHHAVASFRAVECRRYLARVTSSGLTGVVNPRGVTVASLPLGRPGVLEAAVTPLSGTTPYLRWGDWPLRGLALLALVSAAGYRRSGSAPHSEDDRSTPTES